MGGGSNAPMYTCFIRVMEKTSIGGNREGNRKEIGGNRWWFKGNRSFLLFLEHSFCSTGRAGIRGGVRLYKFKRRENGCGVCGWRWGGGGKPRAKVGIRWGNLEMGRRGMLAWTSGWSSSYALASLRPSKILVSHWLQWNYCILVF